MKIQSKDKMQNTSRCTHGLNDQRRSLVFILFHFGHFRLLFVRCLILIGAHFYRLSIKVTLTKCVLYLKAHTKSSYQSFNQSFSYSFTWNIPAVCRQRNPAQSPMFLNTRCSRFLHLTPAAPHSSHSHALHSTVGIIRNNCIFLNPCLAIGMHIDQSLYAPQLSSSSPCSQSMCPSHCAEMLTQSDELHRNFPLQLRTTATEENYRGE